MEITSLIHLNYMVIVKILTFFFIIFIPGFFFLNIIGKNNFEPAEKIILSLGLSIIFLISVGFLLNSLYLIGLLSKPLATSKIVFLISLFIVLLVIQNFKNIPYSIKKIWGKKPINFLKQIKNKPIVLFSTILILLSILSAFIFNEFGINSLSLYLSFLIIAIFFIPACFKLPEKIFPLLIFSLSLSLLYSSSLQTDYILGWDIHGEYHVFEKTLGEEVWNPSIFSEEISRKDYRTFSYYSMLSITVFPVILSKILAIDGNIIFKYIYPFIFSFVPVGLYLLYNKLFKIPEVAFLSVLPFITEDTYLFTFTSLARQEIAFLLLIIFLLFYFNEKIGILSKKFFLTLLFFFMVVSHYSTSYILLFYLILTYTAIYFLKFKFLKSNIITEIIITEIITKKMLFFLILIVGGWYFYTHFLYLLTEEFIRNTFRSFLESQTNPTMEKLEGKGVTGFRWIGHFSGIFIRMLPIIGAFEIIRNFKKYKIKPDFLIMAVISLFLFSLLLITPYLTRGYNLGRIYLQILIFIAPLMYIGTLLMVGYPLKLLGINKHRLQKATYVAFVFLIVIHFSYESGLYDYFMNTKQQKFAYSREGNLYDMLYPHPDEVEAASWLKGKNPSLVYSDKYSFSFKLYSYAGLLASHNQIFEKNYKFIPGSYIYLRRTNLASNFVTSRDENIRDHLLLDHINSQNKVLDTGPTEIFYVK